MVQILSPKRRIDVLRDVMQASGSGRPYVITFCGVNGVGKSTNLAKIAFWLLENDHRVLIAACDTFRSGAVEQLRTHARHLGSLHPPPKEGAPANILLYDRGYGKDAAGVAMEAIHFGELRVDHVNSSVSLSKIFEPPWPAYAPDHMYMCIYFLPWNVHRLVKISICCPTKFLYTEYCFALVITPVYYHVV